MNKPNWEYAPDWARWLAMDPTGEWFWYETLPGIGDIRKCWESHGMTELAQDAPKPWEESLEHRPDPE